MADEPTLLEHALAYINEEIWAKLEQAEQICQQIKWLSEERQRLTDEATQEMRRHGGKR